MRQQDIGSLNPINRSDQKDIYRAFYPKQNTHFFSTAWNKLQNKQHVISQNKSIHFKIEIM